MGTPFAMPYTASNTVYIFTYKPPTCMLFTFFLFASYFRLYDYIYIIVHMEIVVCPPYL